MFIETRPQRIAQSANDLVGLLRETPALVERRGLYISHDQIKPNCFITLQTAQYDPALGNIYIDVVRKSFFDYYGFRIPNLDLAVTVPTNLEKARDFNGWPCMEQTRVLSSKLDGNEFEIDTSMNSYRPLGIDFWNAFKVDGIGRAYQTIYGYVATLIARQKSGGVLVDLFGGDGEFLQRLYQYHRLMGAEPLQMHLYDQNSQALAKAQARKLIMELTGGKSTLFVHEGVDLIVKEPLFEEIEEKPIFVTAIGGLCKEVVTREDALKIAERVYTEMQAGGLFYVTGFSDVLLNAKDFKQIGFTVEGMAVPGSIPSFSIPYQLYILRK